MSAHGGGGHSGLSQSRACGGMLALPITAPTPFSELGNQRHRQETTSSKSDYSEIRARGTLRNRLGVSWLLQSSEGLGPRCPRKPNASLWQDTLTALPCDCAKKLNAGCADAHLSQPTPEPNTCTGVPAPRGCPPGRSGLPRACLLPLFLT